MSWHTLVIKDAAWQLFGRIISALFGFVITKIISSYLWPLRYGDYWTIFRFFAWWTALVDFWVYVIAVKRLWAIKEEKWWESPELKENYHKFVWTRMFMIIIIYTLAIVTAYLIPAYTSNQFIIWWLPLAMLYSASNMFVWIQQLPLQLFWKMNRLSRSLIVARLSQLAVLLPTVYLIFKWVSFESEAVNTTTVLAFCCVIFSVVASSIWQNIDIHLRTKDLLPFKIDMDWQFIKSIFKENWKYWFSYFFSSFHTLIVLMFLGWYFPTAQWYEYVWYWALALSLLEILLIIPSSLGNSLLHKIPTYSNLDKRKSMWNLLTLVGWIGWIIAINFWVFNRDVILFVSSRDFIGSWESLATWWSNQILPFLWIVLFFSFIKQIFNYLFVSLEKQNVLFRINLTWVVVWILVALFVIPKWNLLWWVIVQLLIETIFMVWAMIVAGKLKVFPKFQKKAWLELLWILAIMLIGWFFINNWLEYNEIRWWMFLIIAWIYNLIILWVSLKPIKAVAKGLTID
jgi:O-antigen/teichoic acid export membrane protein